jgi:hypothetical protein
MPTTALNIALLAPVPLEHLLDGRDVSASEGKVAFGSRAWQVFRELDAIRKGMAVDAYIYASHGDGPLSFEASWHARYIGHVESVRGAHPAAMRYRPPSTAKYGTDNEGFWAVFWEVEELREIAPDDRIPVRMFCGVGKSKAYSRGFVPEGPLLVKRP